MVCCHAPPPVRKMQNSATLGYESLVEELGTLLEFGPPPFIYLNNYASPSLASSLVAAILDQLPSDGQTRFRFARVDPILCYSPRIFYDSVINTLAQWTPEWEDGCANWGSELEGGRWNDSLDGFLHGIRAVHSHTVNESASKDKKKRKGKQRDTAQDVRMVIVIDRAERLNNLPDLIVPLTRLGELTQVDICVIFISEAPWEDIRPAMGTAPDPYFIDVPPPSKEVIVKRLSTYFSVLSSTQPTETLNPYHPNLSNLWSHFISTLCDICYPFVHDPDELQYIAAARWPGFVQPFLDLHRQQYTEQFGGEGALTEEELAQSLSPPTEDVRLRLSKIFASSFTGAMEQLYPRITNALDWSLDNNPEPDLLSQIPGVGGLQKAKVQPRSSSDLEKGVLALPRMSQFILVAAFIASTNPAKSDIRMFGRGLDEKKRKRRVAKASGKQRSGPAKIPQRLAGPQPFPLDRLIAILGALLEENDADVRPLAPQYTIPGEYTDMETSRVGIFSSVMELTKMHLLYRTSPNDKLDGPPTFKCGISYNVALVLARHLDTPLNDLMWDPL